MRAPLDRNRLNCHLDQPPGNILFLSENEKTPTRLQTIRWALVSRNLTFGNLALTPDDYWTLAAARNLHIEFHKIDESIAKYYTNAVDALRALPTEPERLRTIYPMVWDFLRRWGRVQGLTEADNRKMLKTLNLYGRLLRLLRGYSLEDDLSKVVSFDRESRTLANWMQVILRDVSHQRRHEVMASTKLLHAAVPKLFPMFDNQISRKFFGVTSSVHVYCGLFLPLAKNQIKWLREGNIKPDRNQVCAGSWAKLIDEINWTWANPYA